MSLSMIFGVENFSTCRDFSGVDFGKTFLLTQDISTVGATCLEINENNIKIDCQGHSVVADDIGIEINAEINITISNCNVNSKYALDAEFESSHIINNTFNSTIGSIVKHSDANTFVCNRFIGGDFGVHIDSSSANHFSCLSFSDTNLAINVTDSSADNTYEGNISSSVDYAIELEPNDLNILDNRFALILFGTTAITTDLNEFEEHFDNDENNITQTYRVSSSEFNFFTPVNTSLNNVNVSISTDEKPFSFSSILNSSNSISLFKSYFLYDNVTSDFIERDISNYSILVSKSTFNTVSQNLSFQNSYNFTMYSTLGISINAIDFNSTLFNNESQTYSFNITDFNNYSISNLTLSLNSTDINYSSNGSIYSFNLNGSNMSLGDYNITIFAKNEFNVTKELKLNLTIASSSIPQINASFTKDFVFINETVGLNVTIDTNSSYRFTITNTLNQNLSNVSFQNVVINESGEIIFTIEVVDENGLKNSFNISLDVYLNETLEMNITNSQNLTTNSTTTIEIDNIDENNNQTITYLFYINTTLVQNSSNQSFTFDSNDYLNFTYDVFDNVTNITQTFLNVTIIAQTPIGTQGEKIIQYSIFNSSNLSISVSSSTSIKTNQQLSVSVSYQSSLNYSYDSTKVYRNSISNSTLIGEYNTTSFSLPTFSVGNYDLIYVVCNEYDECRELNKSLSVSAVSSGNSGGSSGGGGGGSSRSSRSSSSNQGLGDNLETSVSSFDSDSRDLSQDSLDSSLSIDNETESITDDESVSQLDVIEGNLVVNELDVNEAQSGFLTSGIGSLLSVIIGFLLILIIIVFAFRRSKKNKK